MVVKIFKAVWFLSLLAAVAVLLYVYASYPDIIQLSEGGEGITRDGLFYVALALLGILNALVFLVNRLMPSQDPLFHSWFYGLIVFFNLFMIVALEFFNLYNSQERFDYARIGYIIYGSVAMIILWASLWPIARITRSMGAHQSVGND